MSSNTPPPPSTQGAINSIFRRVFDFDRASKSATELLDMFSDPALRDDKMAVYYMSKMDKNRVVGSWDKLTRYDPRTIIDALRDKGVLSSHMEQGIWELSKVKGGEFRYDGGRALFFGTKNGYAALPIQGIKTDVVTFGHTSRAVNTLGILGSNNQIRNFSYADAWYDSLVQIAQHSGVDEGNYLGVLQKKVFAGKVSEFGRSHTKTLGSLAIDKPVVFFDLETNGLNTTDDIVQFAAYRLDPGNPIPSRRNYYFDYKQAENAEAVGIHKITRQILQAKGAAPFEHSARDIEAFFKDAIIAGHNVSFDAGVLNASLRSAGINANIGEHGMIDTFQLFKAFAPGNTDKKLTSAFKYYTGSQLVGAHNAQTDVEAVVTVLNYMIGSHRNLPTSAGQIASMMKNGSGLALQFGGPSLKNVLAGSNRMRGVTSKMLGVAPNLLQKLVLSPESELAVQLTNFKEAKRIMTTVVKGSGRAIRSDGIGILAGMGRDGYVQGSDAMRRAREVWEHATNALPGIYQRLGLEGLWPLGKAEHLIMKDGQVTLPTAQAGRIYGSMFNEAAYGKGLHQYYKRTMTSNAQGNAMALFNRRALRGYLTRGAYDAGEVFHHQGVSLSVGVVSFENELKARQMFGEGGAILSDRGASILRSTLPTHRIEISDSEAKMRALEKLYGVNLSSGKLDQLNAATTYTTKEFRNAVRARGFTGPLTEKEALLAELLKGNKTYHNVFKQVA